MKVSTLKKNPKNPRQIKGEKLELLKKSVGSFQKMMTLRPMIVDENNIVLGGNMRLAAIKALGLKEIPDEWVKQVTDLTPDEKAEFVIKDNNSFGEYDWDAISNEWTDYPLADWGLDVPGFEAVEEVGDADAEPQIDKAAELNKKWGVASGDLWQIGEHRLLCGDSTNVEQIASLRAGQQIDMVFTDPPYAIYGSSTGAKNDDNMIQPFFRAVWEGIQSTTAVDVYMCCDWRSLPTVQRTCVGYEIKDVIVWDKGSGGLGNPYRRRHEFIVFARPATSNIKMFGRKSGGVSITDDDVWTVSRVSDKEHNAQKPTEIVQRAISNSSNVDGNVYEPFAGSGTTLVACENLNRKCYAIEISPDYCAVILERMATAFPDIEIKRIDEGKATN